MSRWANRAASESRHIENRPGCVAPGRMAVTVRERASGRRQRWWRGRPWLERSQRKSELRQKRPWEDRHG